MKLFIGTKLLKAKPMTRGEYNVLRGWTLPANENPSDEGYLVEYLDGGKANHPCYDGYISWSPKDVFEAAYRVVSGLSLGLAIEAAKKGERIARAGWNGKGQFVYLVPAASYPVQTGAAKAHFGAGAMVPYNAYLALKTVDNTVSTWAPSVSDCLADDWLIVRNTDAAPVVGEDGPLLAEPMKLQPHQQRVVDELAQNEQRRTKLADFIKTNPVFDKLPDAERLRLTRQHRIMAELSDVIGERIAAF
ncbi:DUF2829 domain-containing protein [Paraburkholderia terrae]|uniref:DUF2829 domain-containing protein n=1 Tax=Paraburkholderia terrae TaxID=311230 RepID=UPI001EE38C8A|nr:DUF2829 domain-containing protein [Paraburkholderia terrae]GJH00223.1 hypothetical protein CBA19C8_06720 [Paraburkholderia terrae]